MLICVAIIMIVITFFGCCGALQENYCMISMVRVHKFKYMRQQYVMKLIIFWKTSATCCQQFAVLLGLLFVIETTLGFTAYALSNETQTLLRGSLNDTMRLYNKSYELTKVWDGLQSNVSFRKISKNFLLFRIKEISWTYVFTQSGLISKIFGLSFNVAGWIRTTIGTPFSITPCRWHVANRRLALLDTKSATIWRTLYTSHRASKFCPKLLRTMRVPWVVWGWESHLRR